MHNWAIVNRFTAQKCNFLQKGGRTLPVKRCIGGDFLFFYYIFFLDNVKRSPL